MILLWKTCLYILVSLLLLSTPGVSQDQFQLNPLSVTKLLGSEARYRATVQGSWTFMTWFMKDLQVLTMPISGNATSSSSRFSGRFCNGVSDCVEFIIQNLTRQDSGSVICSVQGPYGSKTAQLIVQESGSVSVSGGDRTAKQDEQVEFKCSTAGWSPKPTITWTLNGNAANSSLVNTTHVAYGDTYNSTSVLKFQATRNTTVACLATVDTLPNPISKSVQLTVVPKPTDWTVLIAIVLAFSCAALLFLLIFGIIFFCRRKREKQPNYQAEMMRQRTQSQISNGAAFPRQGRDNPVFTIDGQTSLPRSGLSDTVIQNNRPPIYEFPAADNNMAGNTFNTVYNDLELDMDFQKKHRHLTMV